MGFENLEFISQNKSKWFLLTSCFCRGSRERPFEKFASFFCISTKALFTLLTFSSFTMFIFLRFVVTGFTLFLTLKLFWLAMWNTFLDFSPLSLFLAIVRPPIPLCSFSNSRWCHLHAQDPAPYLTFILGRFIAFCPPRFFMWFDSSWVSLGFLYSFKVKVKVMSLSRVPLFATLWTVAC